MKKIITILLSLFANFVYAQERGYIFIEAQPNVPYEVIVDGKTTSSSDGMEYLIIPQIEPGTHILAFKFNGSNTVTKTLQVDIESQSGTIVKLSTNSKTKDEVVYENSGNNKPARVVASNNTNQEPKVKTTAKNNTDAIAKNTTKEVSNTKPNLTSTKNNSSSKQLEPEMTIAKNNKNNSDKNKLSSTTATNKTTAASTQVKLKDKVLVANTSNANRKAANVSKNVGKPLIAQETADIQNLRNKAKIRYKQMVDSLKDILPDDEDLMVSTEPMLVKTKTVQKTKETPTTNADNKLTDAYLKTYKPKPQPMSKLARKQAEEFAKREAKQLKKLGLTPNPKSVNSETVLLPKPKAAKPEVAKPEVTKPEVTKPVITKPVVKNIEVKEPIAKPITKIKNSNKEVKIKELNEDMPKEVDMVKDNKEVNKVEPKVTDIEDLSSEPIKQTKLDRKVQKKITNNVNCTGLSSEEYLVELFKKLEAKVDDDARISVIKKNVAKNKKCFTCKDVEQLSVAFNTQSGKFDFVRQLFPYIQDPVNYSIIEDAFKYEGYKEKIRMEFSGN